MEQIKTRIVYSHKGKYKIQYKKGWFWYDLEKFIYIGVEYEASNCWNPVFELPETAEKIAKRISTPDGFNEFMMEQNEIVARYRKEKAEYIKRIKPFEIKNIS